MSVTLTMEGTDKVIATLDEFTKVGFRKVIRVAMREGAKLTLDKARSLINSDTGDLRRSLKVRAGKADRDSVSMVVMTDAAYFAAKGIKDKGGYRKKGPRGGQNVYTDGFYAAFVELGHKAGKRNGNASVGVSARKPRVGVQQSQVDAANAGRADVPARPFMRPAFDQTKAQVEEHIRAAVDRLIEETNG